MSLRSLRRLALALTLAAAGFSSTAAAQQTSLQYPIKTCPGPTPQPWDPPQPTPLPYLQPGYTLGVQAKTVVVDGEPPVEAYNSGVGTLVAPGYGEAVLGQQILTVSPNSAAYHAGLEPGDIIIDANGVPMDNGQNLVSAIRNSQGRLEMKVIDVRTNRLTWVVAMLGGTTDDGGVVEASLPVNARERVQPAYISGKVTSSVVPSVSQPPRRPPVRRR